MDHNQDAHRQRIIDWINATSGTAGAFDVTTKGILHSGHWRFPGGKEMQGYAYILTHPGTSSVFYDHIFSRYQSEIAALISLRTGTNPLSQYGKYQLQVPIVGHHDVHGKLFTDIKY
ncbi:Alpha-amylase 3, chloroplastic [Morella rubra]|uniref:Alpha-amylase 3, chloroplastic n=1 Tax=Morella rubra TaxID=262757 RepID=A0A6A1V829_9ROSI|nr:Alpha-amylase 3, chloroplastic [Morella rubra]